VLHLHFDHYLLVLSRRKRRNTFFFSSLSFLRDTFLLRHYMQADLPRHAFQPAFPASSSRAMRLETVHRARFDVVPQEVLLGIGSLRLLTHILIVLPA